MTTEAMFDAQAPSGRLAALLGDEGGWREVTARACVGLASCGLFGLSLGARQGGSGLFTNAVGVAAAPAAVLTFGVPALYIVLALFDAPVTGLGVARSAARGTATLGMVLAGLAPLVALYTVSSERAVWGAIAGFVALVLAGMVALGHFHGSLRDQIKDTPIGARSSILLAMTVFGVLVTIAAARIWFDLVPVFGGGL